MLIRDGTNRFDSPVRGGREKSAFCFFLLLGSENHSY